MTTSILEFITLLIGSGAGDYTLPDDYVTRDFCNERLNRMMTKLEVVDEKVDRVIVTVDLFYSKLSLTEKSVTQLELNVSVAEAIKKELQRRNTLLITVTATIVAILSNLDKIINLFSRI